MRNVLYGFNVFRFRIELCVTLLSYVSREMTKPTKWLCAQRRLRSAWASAQSDRSLRCPHEESLGPKLPIKRTAKTLIRLCRCLGWSESLLGAQSLWLFCHVAAQVNLHDVYIQTHWYVTWTIGDKMKWAATWRYQQNDLCAQRRPRSVYASTQTDQSRKKWATSW